jgi:hypothetical protein
LAGLAGGSGRDPDREPPPKADEREIGLILPDRCQRGGGEVLLGDGGHASHGFAAQVAERDATSMPPRRKNERGTRPHLAPIRQPIESILRTCKDLLTLARFCCLAAAITLNHQPARNSRAPLPLTARNQPSSQRSPLTAARWR